MNRTDRLLSILIELQRKQIVTAKSLAEKFETCKRTIYRDMQALSESGVPIFSMPGQGYSLMDGYFLPPIQLKAEEAVTLLLGSDYVEQSLDSTYSVHAHSAKEKLEAILSSEQQKKVKELRETFRFLSGSFSHQTFDPEQLEEKLSLLQESIQQQQCVSFSYRKPNQDQAGPTNRTVNPYGLVNISGIWYMVAHCLLRQQLRHFRLERMRHLRQEQDFFQKPEDFYLPDYQPNNDRTLRIHLLFPQSISHKVIESHYFYIDTYEQKEDGFHVFLKARQIEDVFPWVLSWGSYVKVLQPTALFKRIQEEAKKMLNV
ncbi:YafY family protein [Bacillus sp. DX1.1]|uniref:helix-turn-helix transcriptional regulator n=1 Tax=unclassified Bacillus (in: firmicutes) TaxID=185979 RepID=UPI002570BDB6|nr:MULTISPECIES: YafY family protein [unclassified Bacillus (in: firmicutes)]MDM5153765.1 YafY family protein [Bacillus sp. DX1.1]WJE82702.1 YafY family protein [Bacillus sp. DX3.1]